MPLRHRGRGGKEGKPLYLLQLPTKSRRPSNYSVIPTRKKKKIKKDTNKKKYSGDRRHQSQSGFFSAYAFVRSAMRQRDVPLFISPAKAAEIYPRGSRFVFPILNSANVVRRKCVSHSLRQSEEIPRHDEEASEYLFASDGKRFHGTFPTDKKFCGELGRQQWAIQFWAPRPNL